MVRGPFVAPALVAVFALVLGACTASVRPTASLAVPERPTASPMQSSVAAAPSAAPSSSPVPSPSAPAPSPGLETVSAASARLVVDAAQGVIAAGTVRYEATGHAEGAAAQEAKTSTARGGASFRERRQFWVAIDENPDIRRPSRAVLVDGEQTYLREGDSPHMPDGAWLVLDLPDDTPGWRSIVRTYGDPRLVIAPVLGVVGATPAGTETVGGVAADRFGVQIDPGRIPDALPAHLRDAWERQQADMPGAGPADWDDTEVWIGPDGHLVRMRYAVVTKNPDLPEIVVTYDFDGIGEPIVVAPAPGEEVLTLAEATERYRLLMSPSPSPR